MAKELESLTRKPERGSPDRGLLDALLDDEFVGTLATVTDDGEPWAVPLVFARDGDRIVLHGSPGAGALRHVASGAPVAFTVFTLDGVVVSQIPFDSSARYRSAVLRGRLNVLDSDDKVRALDVVTERILPGRSEEVRRSTPRELAGTAVSELPIIAGQWLYKENTAGPPALEDEADTWHGVVPFARMAGVPEPASGTSAPVPPSVWHLLAGYPGPDD